MRSTEVMQELGYYSRSFPVWMEPCYIEHYAKESMWLTSAQTLRISCMFLKLGVKVSQNKMMHHLKCIKTASVYRFEITLFGSILVVRNHPICSIQICKNGKMYVQVIHIYIYTNIKSNHIIYITNAFHIYACTFTTFHPTFSKTTIESNHQLLNQPTNPPCS